MVAQKGKDFLLKFNNAGTYVTVAGLRTRRLAFNAQAVDVTDGESVGRWRELLAGAAVQRAALTASGIFKDAASDALVRGAFSRAPFPVGRSSYPISARLSGRSRSWRWSIPAVTMAKCNLRSRWNRPVF